MLLFLLNVYSFNYYRRKVSGLRLSTGKRSANGVGRKALNLIHVILGDSMLLILNNVTKS